MLAGVGLSPDCQSGTARRLTCRGGQGSASRAAAHEFHRAGADKEHPHVKLSAKTQLFLWWLFLLRYLQ